THGRGTDFSNQVSVTTTKVDDLSNYVDNAAIGDALIGTLTLDRGWVGTLKGNYIDAKQLSVTDGNGKRTLFIDSFGNVSLDVTELKISSKKVATTEEVKETVSQATDNLVSNDEIPDFLTGYAKESYVDDAMENAIINAKDGMISSTELALNNKEILLSAASMGQYNFLYNSDFRNNLDNWVPWGINEPHFGGVVDDYANSMSGENNLFIGSSNGTVGNLNLGYYQTVKLAENSSYTLSYWVNAINCTVHIIVQKVDSDNSVSNIVAKEHSNINGNKDKDTWVFDTLSFNVPEGTQEIRVVFKINNCTDPAYRGFWVKPMLVSGTKAQAWTGHPDEIYVGVVSITEKKGLVVEHNNVDTKTVMSADGFSIEDNNGDVLAWLSSKEQWTEMKVDKVFASNVENIYSGSPNLYVDHSHVGDSDGSADKPFKSFEELRRYLSKTPIINYDLKINVMSKIDCPEMFLLENMKGTGNLGIIFDKSFIGRGLGTLEAGIKLLNIMIPVSLEAECLFDNFSHGAVISNCHLVELKGCIFNVHNYGCLFSNSKGIINEVDFANTYCAIGSERCSIVNVMSASGNGYTNGMGESCRVLTGGIIILGRGNLGAIHIPNGSYSSQGGTIITDGTCDKTNSWSYPPSTSVPSQPSNMNHTYTYNCISKQSYQYNWSNWSTDGSCKQGAWSYGLRGGHMFFDMNKI
ncbi:MAG: hypothetical protein IIW11_01820, partial [Bacteroidales bacterium]|nr:hypothetical protein [Bacteroidales bacterium]